MTLVATLFALLTGPFVLLPRGIGGVEEHFMGGPLALRPFIDGRSHGLQVVPAGLAAASGVPFELLLRFPKLPGQSGRLRIHNAALPGLHTRLALRDGDRPAAPALEYSDLYRDPRQPIDLAPLRAARTLEVSYQAGTSAPGVALVLHKFQLEWDWFPLMWVYLGVSLTVAALGLTAMWVLRPDPLEFAPACPLALLLQVGWWRLGWNPWLYLAVAAAALLGAAWLLRTPRGEEARR